MNLETVKAAVLGIAVGDALGVPVEFQHREQLDLNPVAGMRAFGTHHQPAGTWSDDTSMALCLLESLAIAGLDFHDMMGRFFQWANDGLWTAHGDVFDMGVATSQALSLYAKGTPPEKCGGRREYDNGNGSLMRILPLALALHCRSGWENFNNPKNYEIIHQASGLTHGHPISKIACGIYCAVANELLQGRFAPEDIQHGIAAAKGFYAIQPEFAHDLEKFERVDVNVLQRMPRDEVKSGGFVLHTLEASLWCLLRYGNFKDCLLASVNLGEDTDTTAAVVGGLAGIRWGLSSIPGDWLSVLARREDIEALCENFWKEWA